MRALDLLSLVAPVVVLAFVVLARWARQQGARRLPPGWVRFALGAGGAWWLAGRLAGSPTGLELPLVGVWCAGVLAHGAVQALALRPLLARERVHPAFLGLAFLVFVSLLPWTAQTRPPDGDEPYYLLLTHSLVQDGDADLADDYQAGEGRRFLNRPLVPQPGDPTGPNGEIYSRHNLLLPFLLALPYAVAGKAGALVMMVLLAALLAWRTLALARALYPEHPGGALLAFGMLVLGSPLLLYSGQVWVEVPAALALVVALERLFGGVRGATGGRVLPHVPLALAVAALPLLKLRFTLVAIPLVLLAVWRLRGALDRRVIRLVMGLALAAGLGLLVYNQIAYGNPLKIHAWQELDLARFGPGRYVQGFFGLFFDAAFGLFGAAPLWLLLVPALVLAWRRGDRCLGLVVLIAAPYLLIAAPRDEWYGGWSPPFRYGMVFLPLLAVLLVPLLSLRRRAPLARTLMVVLAAATVAVLTLCTVVPGWAYNLAHGRTHLTDHLAMTTGLDVARFFPSYVRPRTASWVWPPVAAVVATLAFRRSRRRGGSPLVTGSLILLTAAAALPLAAARRPTRTVELEDPWIEHRGGHLYPELWTVSRVGYRGGWVLRPGESLAVPVVAGGSRLTLEIELQFVRNNPDPLTLEVLAGDEVIERWTAQDPESWQHLRFAERDWTPGCRLGLRVVGASRGGPQNGVLIDRLEIRWP
ncbi:MAG: hypothetical protein SF066_08300 [Thermoanaerobaculia bacterium]|nr:hypothetical protein [Thermoanaerobaculia bacterium]